jgi:CspA family cold shock protein
MTRIVTAGCLILMAAVLLTGCGGEESTVVESGTYEGTIQEVNAEENEIYVEVPNTGALELYFTEETTLTRNDNSVPFDTLETGQSVEVEVERVGQRLDPVAVRILE